MNDKDIYKAAKGIEYWFRFYQIVGKIGLLNEDSIKHPLVEYLIADGDDSLKNIKLEDNHPVFTSREVDLISKESEKIKYCIEFKLAGKFTMEYRERQRILDDIIRLYYVNKEHENANSYLIVAGKTKDFITEFRSVYNRTPGKKGRPKKKTEDTPQPELIDPFGFFSEKWLSFNMAKPEVIINISKPIDATYEGHYNNFKRSYFKNEHSSKVMPTTVKTVLKYITEITKEDVKGDIPAMVGIWQVHS